MAETKIYRKKCPHCGLEIISFYPAQIKYNYDTHVKACARKIKKEQEKKE